MICLWRKSSCPMSLTLKIFLEGDDLRIFQQSGEKSKLWIFTPLIISDCAKLHGYINCKQMHDIVAQFSKILG